MIKKILNLTFILFAALSIQSCAKDEVETQGLISGQIYDAVSKEPIRGATLTISPGGASTFTGSDGRYEFINLQPRQYTVSVTHPEYKSDSKIITVVGGQSAFGDIAVTRGESKLNVTPTSLDFSKNVSTLKLTIRNAGLSGSITWNISKEGIDWLTISPSSGTVEASKSQEVIVNVLRDKLTKDTEGAILVSGNGESYSVSVRATAKGSSGGDPGGDPNLNAGLLVYYNFNEGTANDLTENAINATLISSPEFIDDTPSGSGKALYLNSLKQQYMVIPNNILKGQSNFSFSMWVKDFGQGVFFSAISSGNSLHNDYPRLHAGSDGKFNLQTGYGDGATRFSYLFKAIQDGKWHLVTVTSKRIDSGYECFKELYIDGVLVDTSKGTFEGTECSKIYIGGDNDGHLQTYTQNMKIDNIRFYNRKLDATEVLAIYNLEK